MVVTETLSSSSSLEEALDEEEKLVSMMTRQSNTSLRKPKGGGKTGTTRVSQEEKELDFIVNSTEFASIMKGHHQPPPSPPPQAQPQVSSTTTTRRGSPSQAVTSKTASASSSRVRRLKAPTNKKKNHDDHDLPASSSYDERYQQQVAKQQRQLQQKQQRNMEQLQRQMRNNQSSSQLDDDRPQQQHQRFDESFDNDLNFYHSKSSKTSKNENQKPISQRHERNDDEDDKKSHQEQQREQSDYETDFTSPSMGSSESSTLMSPTSGFTTEDDDDGGEEHQHPTDDEDEDSLLEDLFSSHSTDDDDESSQGSRSSQESEEEDDDDEDEDDIQTGFTSSFPEEGESEPEPDSHKVGTAGVDAYVYDVAAISSSTNNSSMSYGEEGNNYSHNLIGNTHNLAYHREEKKVQEEEEEAAIAVVDDDDQNPNNITVNTNLTSATTGSKSSPQFNLLQRLRTSDPKLTHLQVDPEMLQRNSGATNIVDAIFDDHDIIRNKMFLSKVTFDGMDSEEQLGDGYKSFQTLCRIIADSPNLHTLILRDCQIDRMMASYLSKALSKKALVARTSMIGSTFTSIKSIEIENCDFERSSCSMAILFMGIQHCAGQIQELTMINSSNCVGFISDIVFASLPLLKLRTLCLVNMDLSANDIDFLYPNLMATLPTLKELNLSQTTILSRDWSCLKHLLECVASPHSNIEKLTLADCQFTPVSMKLFPLILGGKSSPSSDVASPSSTGSQSSGSTNSSPTRNTSILTMITPGATAGQSPEKPKQHQDQQHQHQRVTRVLKSIDLSDNPDIEEKGCKYLLQLLKNCPNITGVNIRNCGCLSKSILAALDDKLRYNNSFLQKIGFSSDVSLAILDSVQLMKVESFNILQATKKKNPPTSETGGSGDSTSSGSNGSGSGSSPSRARGKKERNKVAGVSSTFNSGSGRRTSAAAPVAPSSKRGGKPAGNVQDASNRNPSLDEADQLASPKKKTLEFYETPDKSSIFTSFLR